MQVLNYLNPAETRKVGTRVRKTSVCCRCSITSRISRNRALVSYKPEKIYCYRRRAGRSTCLHLRSTDYHGNAASTTSQ